MEFGILHVYPSPHANKHALEIMSAESIYKVSFGKIMQKYDPLIMEITQLLKETATAELVHILVGNVGFDPTASRSQAERSPG